VIPLAGRRSMPPKATLGLLAMRQTLSWPFSPLPRFIRIIPFSPHPIPQLVQASQYLTYLLSQEKKSETYSTLP
jgi:hypothetical protein